MEEVVEEAAMAAGGEGVITSPEVALEVAIRSLEIQDAEPLRSAPMTEAAVGSRGGINCSRTILSTRRRWLSTWRQSARPSSG
jgi:hypothetical protein